MELQPQKNTPTLFLSSDCPGLFVVCCLLKFSVSLTTLLTQREQMIFDLTLPILSALKECEALTFSFWRFSFLESLKIKTL